MIVTHVSNKEYELPNNIDVVDISEAIELLKVLKEKKVDDPSTPSSLFTNQIDTLENVFQARSGELNEKHLGDLEQAIRTHGKLDPVVMWRCGPYAILLEGHHRLEAYRRIEKQKKERIAVPLKWFNGSVVEAVVHAASQNSKAKLPMRYAEKADRAWTLVLIGGFTAPQIIRATSISKRTIMKMNKVKKALGAQGLLEDPPETWWEAQRRAEGLSPKMDEDAREDWVEGLAQKFADRMAKEFSTKLATMPEVTARAFMIHFNRASEKVLGDWITRYKAEVGGEEWELEGDGWKIKPVSHAYSDEPDDF